MYFMFLVYLVLITANLFWIALLLQGLTAARQLEYLPEEDDPSSTPKVSILVPARNESRILSQTLESLLKLDYPDFEIFVIDDHSEDDTFQIASAFVARDPRVRAIRSVDLPPYWRGKTWALQQAAGMAQGNWLLLTDADVLHHPKTLRCALALAQKDKMDLLSVIPHMECRTFWEKVVLPSFAAILNMVRPIHKSNDPNSSVALASGGFLLVKALIFKYLGGYDSIHDAIAEDLQLAQLFKSSGYHIKTVLSKSKWLRTRMYDSFRAIWEGLSRHAFEGSNYNPLRMCAAITAAYLLIVAPFVIGIAAAMERQWSLIRLCLFPVVLMTGMQTILNYKWGISLFYFFSFPLATALYGLIMMNSMLSYYFRGGNLWKGRRYVRHKNLTTETTETTE